MNHTASAAYAMQHSAYYMPKTVQPHPLAANNETTYPHNVRHHYGASYQGEDANYHIHSHHTHSAGHVHPVATAQSVPQSFDSGMLQYNGPSYYSDPPSSHYVISHSPQVYAPAPQVVALRPASPIVEPSIAVDRSPTSHRRPLHPTVITASDPTRPRGSAKVRHSPNSPTPPPSPPSAHSTRSDRSVRGSGEKRYVCNTCNRAFQRQHDATRHQQSHDPNVRLLKSHQCPHCGKSYSRTDCVRRHVQHKHPEDD